MGAILNIDNGERRERFNARIRELICEKETSKHSNLRLLIFCAILCWFTGYGIYKFILDLISFVN